MTADQPPPEDALLAEISDWLTMLSPHMRDRRGVALLYRARDRIAADAKRIAAQDQSALHASAPEGYKCADCTMDKEACPTCYSAWWKKRHPNTTQLP